MSKEGAFLVYCMERYRFLKGVSGREVAELFERYGVYDYILEFFEPLHSIGDRAIAQDIDEFIAARAE